MAFDIKEKNTMIAQGHSYLDCHLIFDVKMNFTRKARFVANGSTTPITSASTYSGVVYREAVRISFAYAVLNDLYIMAADIQNSYLKAPISKKYWSICGPGFGSKLQGCKAYIVRVFYVTCCNEHYLRQNLRECMEMIGYAS